MPHTLTAHIVKLLTFVFCCNSCLVAIGGELFHNYLDVFSSYQTHRLFRSALSRRPPNTTHIDQMTNMDLLEREMVKYCGYLIYHMNCVSTAANLQVFFHTSFLTKYYGLSRRGINALAQYGYLCKLSYFDQQLEVQLVRAHEKIR